ncbi:hypothetical protein Tsubulata_019827 [Turnera subulata]|uniref:MYND-type domain-containing protein n=1 Tax=Turnera subulata TaxID=218843 RepID=A0A9Q0J780_9ROSI|nr:hypothetical protein Tsubulata_019827 [Turnera subulata]
MECAGKGRGTRCLGPPTRLCTRCGAVAYCSVSHQFSHRKEHKEECERFEQQMKRVDAVNHFPFAFSRELLRKQESRCSFLTKAGVHRLGMWAHECPCGPSSPSLRSINDGWDLPQDLCPCRGPVSSISKGLTGWVDYYEWRCIPLSSPVALLLHWPLTLYRAIQIACTESLNSETCNKLRIHYLGPEKELLQLAAFAELQALFPDKQVHLELIGPAIPESRDGEIINLQTYAHCQDIDCFCGFSSESAVSGKSASVTIQLHRGLYHDRFRDLVEVYFLPHLSHWTDALL